jgi:hypothetical protein
MPFPPKSVPRARLPYAVVFLTPPSRFNEFTERAVDFYSREKLAIEGLPQFPDEGNLRIREAINGAMREIIRGTNDYVGTGNFRADGSEIEDRNYIKTIVEYNEDLGRGPNDVVAREGTVFVTAQIRECTVLQVDHTIIEAGHIGMFASNGLDAIREEMHISGNVYVYANNMDLDEEGRLLVVELETHHGPDWAPGELPVARRVDVPIIGIRAVEGANQLLVDDPHIFDGMVVNNPGLVEGNQNEGVEIPEVDLHPEYENPEDIHHGGHEGASDHGPKK